MSEQKTPMQIMLDQIDIRLNKMKDEIIMEIKTASLVSSHVQENAPSFTPQSKPPFDPKTAPKVTAQQLSEIEAALVGMPRFRQTLLEKYKASKINSFKNLFGYKFKTIMTEISVQRATGRDIE